MKVSILIPAYRPLLVETMESLYNQTFKDFEVLINHNNEHDANATESLMNRKLNDLAKIARGEYLLVLCDDDKLEPNYLEEVLRVADGYDIVFTDLKYFGNLNTIMQANPFTMETFIHTTSPWITSLVRKDVWEELGGWSLYQDYGDWDFWFRCYKAGKKAYHLQKPLFLYRSSEVQSSNNQNHLLSRQKMAKAHPEIII